ncbi:primosomal protein N' [Agaricicola taiwanensis]|uniref:Replication restart protein PriA n=1 Tax=Agaricicola taiwanensis TaxID=591372 RepID=A0A8J2VGP2_9RHOB|nr:primosomal protein N' [Agaricicola taiwanensis]GGE27054.1 primosomal protein N' [Agaricicola taiwanensis]
MIRHTAQVLLPVALDRAFTYGVPEGMEVAPGDVVHVPLGRREAVGVVWSGAGEDVPPARLKNIIDKLDRTALPEQLIQFVDWVAAYTLNPRGIVLRMAARGGNPVEEAPRVVLQPTGRSPGRMTPAREKVLSVLAASAQMSKASLAAAAGVSSGVVDGLLREGALERLELPPEPLPSLDPDHHPPVLSDQQQAAATALIEKVRSRTFSATLVEGVTGSGKTEVYLEAVAEALRLGRQALVMLPEIALTGAVIERFAARFGAEPAAWHSTVPSKQRAKTWEAVARGEAKVVVGARSALFLPFRDLGLIVVDEEHDPAFKQEEMPIYHARDMAVVRATLAACPIALVSATPSLETRANAARGRYDHLLLPERFGSRALPTIAVADMVARPPQRGRFIGPDLEGAVRSTLDAGHQALLFLNRRGYAPLTLCRACGHRLQCPNCSAWLVEHRYRGQLACHHCGHNEPIPRECPSCHTPDKLAPVGPGVERLADEVRAVFPEARLSVLSSDLMHGVDQLRAELKTIAEGQVDLVIGTQLVTKGHNFPGLALVGVVDADLGLGTADPRAAERTFQVLDQVTGRAGRGAVAGRAVLQSFDARHPVMKAIVSGERAGFYETEMETREAAGLPPFGRIASLVVSAAERPAAEHFARRLAQAAPRADDLRILGPAEAAIALLRGRHRMRLTVKAPRGFDLSGYVRQWLAEAPQPSGNTTVTVDIDPLNFL